MKKGVLERPVLCKYCCSSTRKEAEGWEAQRSFRMPMLKASKKP